MTTIPKHIILSRKGFDSSAGGAANWLYQGQLYPIPIPQAYSGVTYKELHFNDTHSYYDVMKDLGITQFSEGHLDPDIDHKTRQPRPAGWKPIFGQHAAALSHLNQRQVGLHDLFLFFGWFKEIEQVNGKFRYKKDAQDLHIIWGYLEVDEIVDLSTQRPYEWMKYHAHHVFADDYQHGNLNSIYVAKDQSAVFPGRAGAQILPYQPTLTLTQTQNNKNRGYWKLPSCFFDTNGKCLLSYHEKRFGEKINKSWFNLSSANRGQEFVLDTQKLTQSKKNSLKRWLNNLLL